MKEGSPQHEGQGMDLPPQETCIEGIIKKDFLMHILTPERVKGKKNHSIEKTVDLSIIQKYIITENGTRVHLKKRLGECTLRERYINRRVSKKEKILICHGSYKRERERGR